MYQLEKNANTTHTMRMRNRDVFVGTYMSAVNRDPSTDSVHHQIDSVQIRPQHVRYGAISSIVVQTAHPQYRDAL